MPNEVVERRLYQEGNKNLKIVPIDFSSNAEGTFGTAETFEGLVSIDITFSRTVTNTAADDVSDYLRRESQERGEGTITLIGITYAQYQKLYNNIVDSNGVIVMGDRNQSKKVGVSFTNTSNYVDNTGASTSSENMFFMPSVVFALPNITSTTLSEDDSGEVSIAIPVTATARRYTKKNSTDGYYTRAKLNSVNNADIYAKVKEKGYYIPDEVIDEL